MNANDIITRITDDLGLNASSMTAVDWQLIAICLEDGEALEALGIMDDEQEAVEEAHSLAKDKRREALLATAAAAPAGVDGLIADWRDQARRLRNEAPNLRDGTDKRFMAACDADRAADELEALIQQPAPSTPVGVEGLMQLARNWCLTWGEWAHDADPGGAKENAAETALRAALTTALAQQPAACVGCEGNPAPENTPCAVCGQQPAVHPAITHCDNCGCDWLDNGLNPVGCPYCKQPAACDMGELCLGCEPRNADGSCPDQQPEAVDEAMPALIELVTTLAATGTVTGGRIYFPERQTRELLKKARDALAAQPGGSDNDH